MIPFKAAGSSDPQVIPPKPLQVGGGQGHHIRMGLQMEPWGNKPALPKGSALLSLWSSLQYFPNHNRLSAPYSDLRRAQPRLTFISMVVMSARSTASSPSSATAGQHPSAGSASLKDCSQGLRFFGKKTQSQTNKDMKDLNHAALQGKHSGGMSKGALKSSCS